MDFRTLKTFRIFMIAVGAVLLIVGCALKTPPKKFDLNEIIEDVERKAYVIQRFRAEFVKTRSMSVFNRSLTASGRLIFEKPNRFRLVTSGDVNVEILSDGEVVSLVHDKKDQEIRVIHGDRDWASFADPLIVILQNLSNGALRKFSTEKTRQPDGGFDVILRPSEATSMERIDQARLTFSAAGLIKQVTIHFKNGDMDQTVFRSWAMVTEDDPEIVCLDRRLKELRSLATQPQLEFPQSPACCVMNMPQLSSPALPPIVGPPTMPKLSLEKQPFTTP